MSNETTPGNVRLNDGLGQLPEPDVCHEMARDDWREDWSYSADAVRAYAAEQVAAERERCARIVDAPAGAEAWEIIGGQDGIDRLRELAARIRA